MESLTTVSLLVAAILMATCTARTIDVDNDDYNQVSPSPSSSEESFDYYTRRLETACFEKTGSDLAIDAFSESFTAVPSCSLRNMNVHVDDVDKDLERLNASTRHEIFPKYCPLIHKALPCLDTPVKRLSKCFSDEVVQMLNAMLDAMPEVLDLLCANDGEILFVEGATYDVCLRKLPKYVAECFNLAPNSKTNTISKRSESQFEVLVEARVCMQRKFNECNGSRLMDVFDVFWREMFKRIPYKNDPTN